MYFVWLQLPDGSFEHRAFRAEALCVVVEDALVEHLERRASVREMPRELMDARGEVDREELERRLRIEDEGAQPGPSVPAVFWRRADGLLRGFSRKGDLMRAVRNPSDQPFGSTPELSIRFPAIASFVSTVVGADVLVEASAVTPQGEQLVWLRGHVVGTPHEVRLLDGRVLPGATRAAFANLRALSTEVQHAPIVCKLAGDGSAWVERDGKLVRQREVGAGVVSPLSSLLKFESRGPAPPFLAELAPDTWSVVELAR